MLFEISDQTRQYRNFSGITSKSSSCLNQVETMEFPKVENEWKAERTATGPENEEEVQFDASFNHD